MDLSTFTKDILNGKIRFFALQNSQTWFSFPVLLNYSTQHLSLQIHHWLSREYIFLKYFALSVSYKYHFLESLDLLPNKHLPVQSQR